MKILGINYQKTFGLDGTVYKQFITIDKELQNEYNKTLQKEYDRLENQNVFSYDDMKIKSYTEKLKDGINYLHLTGLYYFRNTVLENKIDTKNRLKLDRNTIVLVK